MLKVGLSVVIDLGSIHDVIGDKTGKSFDGINNKSGQHVTYTDRDTVLSVSGAIGGEAKCSTIGTYPIAVQNHFEGAISDKFTANIATGITKPWGKGTR